MEKGNRIENWNASYQHLAVTFSEKDKTPSDISNNLQHEAVYQDIISLLGKDKRHKVLECGCGGARTSLYLARQGLDVTCSDFSPEALNLAKRNFEEYGVAGKFVLDDLLNSKLPPASFDCIISFGLLEHFEDVTKVAAAISALLRPGGVHIHTIIPKKFSTQMVMDAFWFPFRLSKNIVRGRFDQIISRSFRDFPHFENRFNETEYKQFFEQTGNRIVSCKATGSMYPFISLPAGLSVLLLRYFSGPVRQLLKATEKSESTFMHRLSSTIYLVAQKTSGTGAALGSKS